MAKIKVILDLKPPINAKQIKYFLAIHDTAINFIRHYLNITFPMDELLKNDVEFVWSVDCNESFELLKIKLVEDPLLTFPYWSKKFHVHVDESNITIISSLSQSRDEIFNHPNAYVSWKLNKT